MTPPAFSPTEPQLCERHGITHFGWAECPLCARERPRHRKSWRQRARELLRLSQWRALYALAEKIHGAQRQNRTADTRILEDA